MNLCIKVVVSLIIVLLTFLPGAAVAQDTATPGSGYTEDDVVPSTLIPATDKSEKDCFKLIYQLQLKPGYDFENLKKDDLVGTAFESGVNRSDVLACALKTGTFRIWMLPLLITYIINFLLSVAGVIAVLFVLIGGYIYMFGGLSDDKERGKKAILYGVVGFAVALLSWVVVNAVQILATS